MSEAQQLRSLIMLPTGKKRPGAMSRASERLGVARSTIQKWIDGEWTIGEASKVAIVALAESGKPLEAKKRGPRN